MISINDDMIKRLEARSYDIFKEPLTYLPPISLPIQDSIVTLEKAIEPLINILPNLLTFVSIVKEKCLNPGDDLTQDESASIMLYTMNWQPMEECLHYVLNSTLRCPDREKLKPWYLYLTLLLKSLSHLPSLSIPIYRQVEINLIDKYPLGNTFIWWSFPICSLSCDIFQSNENLNKINSRSLFKIECHSGKDIRKHSFYPNEDQILLMSACEFQVILSITNDDGQHEIHLKEIQSSNQFFEIENSSNSQEILSANFLLKISNRNVQSRTRVETIEKYINRSLKLQNKIENYSLYSSIDLVNQNLDDQDISLIVQHAIILKQCFILRLDQNFITEHGINILVDSLYNNKTLIGLNLYSNRLFDKGLHPLGKLLSTNHSIIQKLHLGSNRISNEGAFILADMLKTNTSLNVLWLDSNRIGNEGVHFLANALIHYNKHLKELSLKKNKLITNLSVPDFIDILQQNQILTILDISNCNLNKDDNQRLKHIADEKKHFILKFNTKDDDCVMS